MDRQNSFTSGKDPSKSNKMDKAHSVNRELNDRTHFPTYWTNISSTHPFESFQEWRNSANINIVTPASFGNSSDPLRSLLPDCGTSTSSSSLFESIPEVQNSTFTYSVMASEDENPFAAFKGFFPRPDASNITFEPNSSTSTSDLINSRQDSCERLLKVCCQSQSKCDFVTQKNKTNTLEVSEPNSPEQFSQEAITGNVLYRQNSSSSGICNSYRHQVDNDRIEGTNVSRAPSNETNIGSPHFCENSPEDIRSARMKVLSTANYRNQFVSLRGSLPKPDTSNLQLGLDESTSFEEIENSDQNPLGFLIQGNFKSGCEIENSYQDTVETCGTLQKSLREQLEQINSSRYCNAEQPNENLQISSETLETVEESLESELSESRGDSETSGELGTWEKSEASSVSLDIESEASSVSVTSNWETSEPLIGSVRWKDSDTSEELGTSEESEQSGTSDTMEESNTWEYSETSEEMGTDEELEIGAESDTMEELETTEGSETMIESETVIESETICQSQTSGRTSESGIMRETEIGIGPICEEFGAFLEEVTSKASDTSEGSRNTGNYLSLNFSNMDDIKNTGSSRFFKFAEMDTSSSCVTLEEKIFQEDSMCRYEGSIHNPPTHLRSIGDSENVLPSAFTDAIGLEKIVPEIISSNNISQKAADPKMKHEMPTEEQIFDNQGKIIKSSENDDTLFSACNQIFQKVDLTLKETKLSEREYMLKESKEEKKLVDVPEKVEINPEPESISVFEKSSHKMDIGLSSSCARTQGDIKKDNQEIIQLKCTFHSKEYNTESIQNAILSALNKTFCIPGVQIEPIFHSNSLTDTLQNCARNPFKCMESVKQIEKTVGILTVSNPITSFEQSLYSESMESSQGHENQNCGILQNGSLIESHQFRNNSPDSLENGHEKSNVLVQSSTKTTFSRKKVQVLTAAQNNTGINEATTTTNIPYHNSVDEVVRYLKREKQCENSQKLFYSNEATLFRDESLASTSSVPNRNNTSANKIVSNLRNRTQCNRSVNSTKSNSLGVNICNIGYQNAFSSFSGVKRRENAGNKRSRNNDIEPPKSKRANDSTKIKKGKSKTMNVCMRKSFREKRLRD